MSRKPLYVINGPNLNRLGKREPEIYGYTTLAEVEAMCRKAAGTVRWCSGSPISRARSSTSCMRRSTKGRGSSSTRPPSPSPRSPSSICSRCFGPIIELHISNIHKREAYYHNSFVSKVATAVMAGFGPEGYGIAVQAIEGMIAKSAR